MPYLERIGQHWGSWGDVVDIGLRRTKIRNPDGVVVNYPNSVLATSVITNFSDQRTNRFGRAFVFKSDISKMSKP